MADAQVIPETTSTEAAGNDDSALTSQVLSAHRERASAALTLSDEELDLLRGIPMNSLLSWGASVLANSKGSASTYKLSQVAAGLDIFLSHNWSVSRLRKFLALAFYFNLGAAVAAASVAAALCFSLQAVGLLPLLLSGGCFFCKLGD